MALVEQEPCTNKWRDKQQKATCNETAEGMKSGEAATNALQALTFEMVGARVRIESLARLQSELDARDVLGAARQRFQHQHRRFIASVECFQAIRVLEHIIELKKQLN